MARGGGRQQPPERQGREGGSARIDGAEACGDGHKQGTRRWEAKAHWGTRATEGLAQWVLLLFTVSES